MEIFDLDSANQTTKMLDFTKSQNLGFSIGGLLRRFCESARNDKKEGLE